MSPRGRDSETGRLWVEEGEPRIGLIASAAPVLPIDRTYSFTVPDELAERIEVGHRIQVPVGRKGRLIEAFCLSLGHGPWTSTLRPIDSLVDPVSYLDQHLLDLGEWIARHYACPLGRTLKALVPAAVREQRGFRTLRLIRLARPLDEIHANTKRLGAKQAALLDHLAARDRPIESGDLQSAAGISSGTIRQAVQRGWLEQTTQRKPLEAPQFDLPRQEPGFELNSEQQTALAAVREMIDQRRFQVALLFGVSGCGKTEVYIRAMQQVVAAGRQALMLVPEIALTTQLVNRLACRFDDVAVIHSGLTELQRSLTWNAIRNGAKRVVIGTRSAIFAPCRELGLIVVDEEQESSYKNLQAPRYHVRDVAVKRGQLENLPVLLGSATPSLESWVNCDRTTHYHRLNITRRVHGLPMPEIELVDMREEYAVLGRFAVLSRRMEQELAATLDRGEQAVILLNRRGFASWIFCPRCRQRLECPNCNVSLVYHSAGNCPDDRQCAPSLPDGRHPNIPGVVICHYCGRRERVPQLCPDPSCRGELVHFGIGTQRVEQSLARFFSGKRFARVDSDTMRHARSYQQVIDDFEQRRIDALVGTQMIAKGLDFPHVAFVGVINGDPAGAASDFRASERLFQLITQVAGRAGRSGTRGRVIVQTTNPEAAALLAAIQHDYRAFAGPELAVRRRLGYPPFARLTRIVLAHAREEQASGQGAGLAVRIRQTIERLDANGTDVIGPQPCVISRLRGLYRYDLLLRSRTADQMREVLNTLRADHILQAKVKSLTVDVDPVDLG